MIWRRLKYLKLPELCIVRLGNSDNRVLPIGAHWIVRRKSVPVKKGSSLAYKIEHAQHAQK
jgi:hypothetical protein